MKKIFSVIGAIGSALFSMMVLVLPWKWRPAIARNIRTVIYWLATHVPVFQQVHNSITKEQEGALKTSFTEEDKSLELHIPPGEQVAISYSGGSDSTLAAIYLSDHFEKIHLCTFKDSGKFGWDDSRIRGNKLIEKYGSDRIVHTIIDVDEILKDVYFSHFWKDLAKWGLFKANFCGACKIAMTIGLMRYCVEHDIHYIASGANKEFGQFYIGQMPATEPIFKAFASHYKIREIAPVYNVERTDKILYEMGFHDDWKGAKFGLLLDGAATTESLDKRGQAGCHQDIFYSIYLQGYLLPMKGAEKFQELSMKYAQSLLDEFGKKWIDPVIKQPLQTS